jgi:hypothetical protein
VSFVKPSVKSGSRGVQRNLFCNFWTLLQVFTNFRSLRQFLEFKQLQNDLKNRRTVSGRNPAHGYSVLRAPRVVTACGTARWCARRRLTGGYPAVRFSVRQGSPRRLGGGGVAGSGRRYDVSVEDDSNEGVASSGAVLRLEAEAREVVAGAASERSAAGGSALLKGGEGGSGASGDAWGRAGEREGTGAGATWDSAAARRD